MRHLFGDYTLDAEHYALHRDGIPVRLEPRVFNLVAYLVRHSGRTITKEELRQQLWPDQAFMTDDPLTNCVAQARKALGDSGQVQRYIKTIHGRGYCSIAPVDVRPSAVPEVSCPTPPDLRIPAELRRLGQADTPLPALPAPLAAPLPAQDATRAARAAEHRPAAEQRQLTVLVCRLVGLSASAAPLDPEVLLEVVRDYQEVCAAVVQRFDGHIAQAQSDRLLVYFGYPQAHEDDARRAVHTGLGLVAEMAELTRRLKYDRDARLAVRVGIHTGVMVIGALCSGDQCQQLTLGDTPTIAARLHSLAEPDTVVISLATWRLVTGYFACQALGAHMLADLSEPLTVYRVL
jgi:class 3 adenylate cyclase/DNA-binding winged helix-turn-helix (wHTH) protein